MTPAVSTVWLVAVSCLECDSTMAAVYDHEPTNEEQNLVKETAGGMYCINVMTSKLIINGTPVELDENE